MLHQHRLSVAACRRALVQDRWPRLWVVCCRRMRRMACWPCLIGKGASGVEYEPTSTARMCSSSLVRHPARHFMNMPGAGLGAAAARGARRAGAAVRQRLHRGHQPGVRRGHRRRQQALPAGGRWCGGAMLQLWVVTRLQCNLYQMIGCPGSHTRLSIQVYVASTVHACHAMTTFLLAACLRGCLKAVLGITGEAHAVTPRCMQAS